MSGVFQEIIVTVRTLSHCQTWVSFFYLDPSLLCLPCWFQPTHPVISIFSTWPIQNLARMIMGAQQRTSQPISQWSQNETLGGNIWGWLTLLFLSAKRKWVLILKHEFPLETVSLNEHLKLQIVLCVFFFEAAQNHIVVIFWFLSQPQIFKCQNLAKPPANVCHGNWPTKTANSNESLHSGSVLKLHPTEGLGPTCARAQSPFAAVSGCVHDWDFVQRKGAACLPLPSFPPLLPVLSFCY